MVVAGHETGMTSIAVTIAGLSMEVAVDGTTVMTAIKGGTTMKMGTTPSEEDRRPTGAGPVAEEDGMKTIDTTVGKIVTN